VIKALTGQPVNFMHINNKGIGCIIGDLDVAQAKGLGLYLCSIDSSKQWDEHLTYIFKSCVIHFQRYNITIIIVIVIYLIV
jgi:hypothetical protein